MSTTTTYPQGLVQALATMDRAKALAARGEYAAAAAEYTKGGGQYAALVGVAPTPEDSQRHAKTAELCAAISPRYAAKAAH